MNKNVYNAKRGGGGASSQTKVQNGGGKGQAFSGGKLSLKEIKALKQTPKKS